jgi:hypothetical protein
MVEHPDYESIRAKILAIYAVYKTPAQLLPRYKTSDPETRATIEKIFDIWQQFAGAQRAGFRASLPQARVVEIDGASHYVFISHREKVRQETRAFLETL